MLPFNNVVVQILKVIKNRLQLFSMSSGVTGTPSNTQRSHLDFASLITYAREIIIITADFFFLFLNAGRGAIARELVTIFPAS